MEILSILRFLFLLSVLIFVHEGGHFLIARLFGVAVEEFGFGIPPLIWGKKIGGTIYSINLLPIGGFVRLKGEEGETLGFGGAGSFAIQSKLKRAGIVAAGALGNFVLAWLVFSLLWGLGKNVSAEKVLVNKVSLGSPAAAAGSRNHDRYQRRESSFLADTLVWSKGDFRNNYHDDQEFWGNSHLSFPRRGSDGRRSGGDIRLFQGLCGWF